MKRETWFTQTSQNSQRTTRATEDRTHLSVRKRTEARGHFFSLRVVKPWKELPKEVKESESSQSFKKKLRNHREKEQTSWWRRTNGQDVRDTRELPDNSASSL